MAKIIPIGQLYKHRNDLREAFDYLDEGEYLRAFTAYKASLPADDLALLFLEELIDQTYEDFANDVFIGAYESYISFDKPIDIMYIERYLQILYQNDEFEKLRKHTKALRSKGSSFWLLCDYFDQQLDTICEFADDAEYGALFDADILKEMITANFSYGAIDYDFRFDPMSLKQSLAQIRDILAGDVWTSKEKAILLQLLAEAEIEELILVKTEHGEAEVFPCQLPVLRNIPLFELIGDYLDSEPSYALTAQTLLTLYILELYPFIDKMLTSETLLLLLHQLVYEMNNDSRALKLAAKNKTTITDYDKIYPEFKKFCFNN
ncbi:hypothetical protein [Culicoidibacter larvae]|uniref:Uncharacterized protein n=1 Tax=Culicoidibacter larvae TaxID=2579976 RepID=A0A5R8QFS8_9FIRM|nr:hypothetical protein [Culicoidibacter larvae]TLG76644.1 hypothetical protein FEZ08_03240 [Culicoidibacter larvae]